MARSAPIVRAFHVVAVAALPRSGALAAADLDVLTVANATAVVAALALHLDPLLPLTAAGEEIGAVSGDEAGAVDLGQETDAPWPQSRRDGENGSQHEKVLEGARSSGHKTERESNDWD